MKGYFNCLPKKGLVGYMSGKCHDEDWLSHFEGNVANVLCMYDEEF